MSYETIGDLGQPVADGRAIARTNTKTDLP